MKRDYRIAELLLAPVLWIYILAGIVIDDIREWPPGFQGFMAGVSATVMGLVILVGLMTI